MPCLGGKWQVAHGPAEECRAIWEGYADRMNAIAARLSKDGIALGYHNHEHEFQLRYDGETVFDILYGHLDPAVVMELDTGNAIEGGADPAEILLCHKNTRRVVHCKPWSRETGFNVLLGALGDQNDWPGILAACGPNCQALVVESEAVGDEFVRADACLQALNKLL